MRERVRDCQTLNDIFHYKRILGVVHEYSPFLSNNKFALPFPCLSSIFAFKTFSIPISIRYGICKLAAIAKGKAQFDSEMLTETEKV